jgi:endoglucanase
MPNTKITPIVRRLFALIWMAQIVLILQPEILRSQTKSSLVNISSTNFKSTDIPKDYIRRQGRNLIVGMNDEQILLRGAQIVTYAYWNYQEPDISEMDFYRLRSMNMNVIRFMIYFYLFEDDSNPYHYKQSGWDLINECITWAKKAGIYVILSFVVDPESSHKLLWTDSTYQNRYVALWKEIARRYSDEPVVAGYELLNEPHVPKSRSEWEILANKVISEIRTVDPHHLVMIENACAIANDNSMTNKPDYFLVNDSSTIYVFHFYSPWDYSQQDNIYDDTPNRDGGFYPDSNHLEFQYDIWWPNNLQYFSTSQVNYTILPGNTDWTFYEGEKYKITNPRIMSGIPYIESSYNAGSIYLDDIEVREYDENGNFVQTVARSNFDKLRLHYWYFWSSNGSGTYEMDTTIGHGDSRSLHFSGTTGVTHLYSDHNNIRFIPRYEHSYSICGWIKGKNVSLNSIFALKVIYDTTSVEEKPFGCDKNYLDNEISRFVQWGIANDRPLIVTEYNCIYYCFLYNKGGLTYMNDVIDLFQEYNINHTCHGYHGPNIYTDGIYNSMNHPIEQGANWELINLFKSKYQALGGYYIQDSIIPEKVTNLTASFDGHNVHLTWNEGSNDKKAAFYEIFTDQICLDITANTYYDDTTFSIKAGNIISYTIRPSNASGLRGPISNPIVVNIPDTLEKISNGRFEGNISDWIIYQSGSANFKFESDSSAQISGQFSGKITIIAKSTVLWEAQIQQPFLSYENKKYVLQFKIKADNPTNLDVLLEQVHSPWSKILEQNIQLTRDIQTFTFTNSNASSLNTMALKFQFGLCEPGRTIWLDDVSLKEINLKTNLVDHPENGNKSTFSLYQNYPNPFNPSTTISYSISQSSFVSLKIYDVVGREIESLVNEDQNPGEYSIRYNASRLPSGIYFLRLSADGIVEIKKCVFIK